MTMHSHHKCKKSSDKPERKTVKSLKVCRDALIKGNLEVLGNSTFRDNVQMDKNLNVNGDTTLKNVTSTGQATLNNLTVNGQSTLNNVTVNGEAEFDGEVTFNNDATFNNVHIKESLEVDGPIIPYSKQTVTVGIDFPTIQSVFDSFKGKNIGEMTVIIPPGTYTEYLNLEGFSAQVPAYIRDVQQGDLLTSVGYKGLQILGDNRAYGPGKSYVNNYENASDSRRNQNYVITTSSPASGPYNARLAANFGGIGGVGPVGIEIANPLNGCGPLVGFTPGNIALMQRGGCGFATKVKNAQLAGASAAIIYNTVPGIVSMIGTDTSITIPAYSISQADGITLNNLITSNPGIQITVTAVGGAYSPPLGTNYGKVNLVKPTFTGDVNGTVLTVTNFPVGTAPIAVGQVISGTGIVDGTSIVSFGTGTGGLGTYNLSDPQAAAAGVNITVTNVVVVTIVNTPLADDNINGPPVLEQPKFDSVTSNGFINIVPGDRIALADSDILNSNYATSLHTITAVNGNIIQFDPPADPSLGGVDLSGNGSNLTFLPNVEITPPVDPNNINNAVVTISQVSLGINGIWINQNPDQPVAKIRTAINISDSDVGFSNVAITDFVSTTSATALNVIASKLNIFDTWRDSSSNRYLSIIGWNQGLFSSQSDIGTGNLFIAHLFGGGGNTLSAGTNVYLSNLQFFGSSALYQPGLAGGFNIGSDGTSVGNSLTVNKLFDIADIVGPGISVFGSEVYAANPSVRIERCYYINGGYDIYQGGIYLGASSQFTIDQGVFYTDGTYATQPTMTSIVRDCFKVIPPFPLSTLLNVGIYVNDDAKFVALGNMQFDNNDYNYITAKTGKYSTPYNALASGAQNIGLSSSDNTLNDIFQHSSSSLYLNNAFMMQSLTATPTNLTLGPADVYTGVANVNDRNKLYIGKTYTLFALTNTVHTLTLDSAQFIPNSGLGTVATFNGQAGSSITFKVLNDTSVLVVSSNGVSIN